MWGVCAAVYAGSLTAAAGSIGSPSSIVDHLLPRRHVAVGDASGRAVVFKNPRRIQAAGALGTVIKVVKSDLFTSIENNTRTSEKWTVVTAD